MHWRGTAALLALAGFSAIVPAARIARAAFLREYPRPPIIVELHPRGDRPFSLDELRHALRLGVHAAELDLRWRAADSTVVCSHRLTDVAGAPSLRDAFDAVVEHQRRAATVQGDGFQFFLFLDLKEESPALHRALVRILADRAARLATARERPDSPRAITIVFTGFRAALERAVPGAELDALGIVEGRIYGARLKRLSGGDGRFQWIALSAPVERSRITTIHEGRDAAIRGRFNVRIVAAHDLMRQAIRSGADAVNADPEEVEAALREAARVRVGGTRQF